MSEGKSHDDQRIADLERVLEAILDGVGAFSADGGWLRNTAEIAEARKVLLDGKP